MKITFGLLLLTLLTSCGKNAFLESKDENGRIIRGVTPGDEGGGQDEGGDPDNTDVCQLKEVVIKSKNRALNKADHPFNFWPMRQAEYNRKVKDGKYKLYVVDYGMIILDFDLSTLNIEDHKVKNVTVNFESDQYFQIDGSYEHESQICHNQNYLCSGIEKSMDGHVINSMYKWIDDDFSTHVNSMEPTEKYCNWALRELREGYDITRMILNGTENFSTNELKSDYSVYITDNHKVRNASLKISYCE